MSEGEKRRAPWAKAVAERQQPMLGGQRVRTGYSLEHQSVGDLRLCQEPPNGLLLRRNGADPLCGYTGSL